MELLTLTDGPTLPVEAIHLAIDLEIRGFVLHAEGPILRVTTRGATERDSLAPEDRAAITKWKPHLLAVVSYCADTIARLTDQSMQKTHRKRA